MHLKKLRDNIVKKLRKDEYKVSRICEKDNRVSDLYFPKHQRKFTQAKPSIKYAEKPTQELDNKNGSLNRQENSTKVKIFLEDSEQIEEFETGLISDKKETSAEDVLGENSKDSQAKDSEKEKELIVEAYTPPKFLQRYLSFTPTKIQQCDSTTPPSKPKAKLSPLMSLHIPPILNPLPQCNFDRNPHMRIQRRFSVCAAPPKPRQPPIAFRIRQTARPSLNYLNQNLHQANFNNQKRSRSPEIHHFNQQNNKHFRQSSTPQFDHRQQLWDNRSSAERVQTKPQHFQRCYREPTPARNFIGIPPPRNLTPAKRSHTPPPRNQSQITESRSRTPPMSRHQNSRDLTRKENLMRTKEIADRVLENRHLRTTQAPQESPNDSPMLPDSTENKPEIKSFRRNQSICTVGEVSSSGIPYEKSPEGIVEVPRNSKIMKSPKDLQLHNEKRNKRKYKRDMKRVEKEMRKMKLREEIQRYTDAGIHLEMWETKRSSADEELRKLQQFNVFQIGGSKNPIIQSNNQVALEGIRNASNARKTAKNRLTQRDKEKLFTKKIIAAAKKSSDQCGLLSPPSPPPGAPPMHVPQPILCQIQNNLFELLPVMLQPIEHEIKKKSRRCQKTNKV